MPKECSDFCSANPLVAGVGKLFPCAPEFFILVYENPQQFSEKNLKVILENWKL